jgi:hypothetical protein
MSTNSMLPSDLTRCLAWNTDLIYTYLKTQNLSPTQIALIAEEADPKVDGQFVVLTVNSSIPRSIIQQPQTGARKKFKPELICCALDELFELNTNVCASFCHSRINLGTETGTYKLFYRKHFKGGLDVHYMIMEALQLRSRNTSSFVSMCYAYILSYTTDYDVIDCIVTGLAQPMRVDEQTDVGRKVLGACQHFDIRPREIVDIVTPDRTVDAYSFIVINNKRHCVVRRKDMILIRLTMMFTRPFVYDKKITELAGDFPWLCD